MCVFPQEIWSWRELEPLFMGTCWPFLGLAPREGKILLLFYFEPTPAVLIFTLGLVLRDHVLWGLGNPMGCWKWNMYRTWIRQTPTCYPIHVAHQTFVCLFVFHCPLCCYSSDQETLLHTCSQGPYPTVPRAYSCLWSGIIPADAQGIISGAGNWAGINPCLASALYPYFFSNLLLFFYLYI